MVHDQDEVAVHIDAEDFEAQDMALLDPGFILELGLRIASWSKAIISAAPPEQQAMCSVHPLNVSDCIIVFSSSSKCILLFDPGRASGGAGLLCLVGCADIFGLRYALQGSLQNGGRQTTPFAVSGL